MRESADSTEENKMERPDRFERSSRSGDRGSDRGGDRRMGIKPNYFLPKPVKVGDVLDVTVEAVASKGDGIAKKDGFVIFVSGAKQGETVNIKITDVKARFADVQSGVCSPNFQLSSIRAYRRYRRRVPADKPAAFDRCSS